MLTKSHNEFKTIFLHKTPLILDQFSHFIPQKTNNEKVYKIFHNRTFVWGVGQIPIWVPLLALT